MNKGQFSIEFAGVLGVLLIILATVSIPLYNNSRERTEKMTDLGRAKEIATKLANGLNMVYASGVGGRRTVNYTLPENISQILIENIPRSDNKIVVRITSNNWDDNVIVNTLIENSKPPIQTIWDNENIAGAVIEYKMRDENHGNAWIKVEGLVGDLDG